MQVGVRSRLHSSISLACDMTSIEILVLQRGHIHESVCRVAEVSWTRYYQAHPADVFESSPLGPNVHHHPWVILCPSRISSMSSGFRMNWNRAAAALAIYRRRRLQVLLYQHSRQKAIDGATLALPELMGHY